MKKADIILSVILVVVIIGTALISSYVETAFKGSLWALLIIILSTTFLSMWYGNMICKLFLRWRANREDFRV